MLTGAIVRRLTARSRSLWMAGAIATGVLVLVGGSSASGQGISPAAVSTDPSPVYEGAPFTVIAVPQPVSDRQHITVFGFPGATTCAPVQRDARAGSLLVSARADGVVRQPVAQQRWPLGPVLFCMYQADFGVVDDAPLVGTGTSRVVALPAPPSSTGSVPVRMTDRRSCVRANVKRILRNRPTYRSAKRNGGGLAAVRCVNINGDHRGDPLFAISSGGTAGNQAWGIALGTRSGRGRIVKFQRGYGLGIGVVRGRPAVAGPIYRPGDGNCCPSGGYTITSYRWASGRVVVASKTQRTSPPSGFDFRPRPDR